MTNSGHNPIPNAGDGGGGGGGSVPIDRIEWSRNTILEFIEDYRGFRVLWDPNTKGYHIKQIKYEALKQLSRKYSTEVRIIRSKIKSLRSSFHREHGKVISGKRRGISYQPMWFAYEAIRFILDGERDDTGAGSSFDSTGTGGAGSGCATAAAAVGADIASVGIDAKDELGTLVDQGVFTSFGSITADDVKTEIIETSNGTVEDLKPTETPSNFSGLLKSRKRRKPMQHNGTSSHQQQIDSDSNDFQSNPRKSTRRKLAEGADEFGVFGEYVGITIRKLKTTKAQVVIKHLINNLLYEAELGRYDFGMPTTREPPHLYATVE